MFKHRFNPQNAHDFGNVIDAVNLMTGRAKSTLNMLNSYIEGNSEDLHKHDVAGVVYCVLAELDDVDDVLNAHLQARKDLKKQIEALSHIILTEKLLTPDKLKLILDFTVLPEEEQEKTVEMARENFTPALTIH